MPEITQQSLPPFPTWPPPSGGAPVVISEMGPILNPYPYGSTQNPVIPANPPPPAHPYSSTFYPKKMVPVNGQNQQQSLPAWPWPTKMTTLPDKAPPSLSQIP